MSKIKERVFGLIVVIALGVIFIPMLLENTQNPKSSVLQDVPAASLAKNETDKDHKPEVLAELNNTPKDKPVVHDESQPISDRPDAKTPGLAEDLKVQEKVEAQEEAKAEALKAEQEKQQLKQQEEAKIVEQLKAEQQRIEQGRRKAEIEQAQAEQTRLEKAKAEQIKADQLRTAQIKAEQAKFEQAKAEQAKAEQAKFEQAKAEQAKAEQAKAERVKAEQAKAERAKAEQAEHKQAAILEAKHEQNKLKAERAVKKNVKVMRHGWVVQMGSFAEHRNSSALLKKLKAAGYPAFTRSVNRHGMQLTIVMVGPHARREDAERLCSSLAAKFEIDGIIVRYEPH